MEFSKFLGASVLTASLLLEGCTTYIGNIRILEFGRKGPYLTFEFDPRPFPGRYGLDDNDPEKPFYRNRRD